MLGVGRMSRCWVAVLHPATFILCNNKANFRWPWPEFGLKTTGAKTHTPSFVFIKWNYILIYTVCTCDLYKPLCSVSDIYFKYKAQKFPMLEVIGLSLNLKLTPPPPFSHFILPAADLSLSLSIHFTLSLQKTLIICLQGCFFCYLGHQSFSVEYVSLLTPPFVTYGLRRQCCCWIVCVAI